MPEDQDEKRIGRKYAHLAKQGGLTPAGKEEPAQTAGKRGYSADQIEDVPEEAIQMGLGCGNPTAIAQLQPGQVVLDLGAGGGLDIFIAAQKVGPTGKAIGVDMTTEMVEKARPAYEKRAEEARVAVRNIRRDILEETKRIEQEKHISEDEVKRFQEQGNL